MYNRGNILEIKNLFYKNEMIKKILNNKEEEQYVINEHLVHLKIFEEHIKLYFFFSVLLKKRIEHFISKIFKRDERYKMKIFNCQFPNF